MEEDGDKDFLRSTPVPAIKARGSSAGGHATADKAPAAAKGRPPRASAAPAAAPKQAPATKPPRAGRPGATGDAPPAEAGVTPETPAPAKKGAGAERPERVRAGFGVYQPKRRGRLEEPDQAPTLDPAPGAHGVAFVGLLYYVANPVCVVLLGCRSQVGIQLACCLTCGAP